MNTQFYVHSADNNHVGPVSADLIARGVLAGKIANGTFVAPAGSAEWLPYEVVGEVADAIAKRSSPPPALMEEEPAPKPKMWLPVAVFGAFAGIGLIETIFAFAFHR